MSRFIDRVLVKIVPSTTASACQGKDLCNAQGRPGLWWRFCRPIGGCEWTYMAPAEAVPIAPGGVREAPPGPAGA